MKVKNLHLYLFCQIFNHDVFISPKAFKGSPTVGKKKDVLRNRTKCDSSVPSNTPEKYKLETIFKNWESLNYKKGLCETKKYKFLNIVLQYIRIG